MISEERLKRIELKVPVYLPEYKSWCWTKELYFDGCTIESELVICDDVVLNLIFDLPIVGPLHLIAKVKQKSPDDKKITRLYFDTNFVEFEDSIKIYYFFMKNLIKLYDVKKMYEDLRKKSQIITHKIPKYSLIIKDND